MTGSRGNRFCETARVVVRHNGTNLYAMRKEIVFSKSGVIVDRKTGTLEDGRTVKKVKGVWYLDV